MKDRELKILRYMGYMHCFTPNRARACSDIPFKRIGKDLYNLFCGLTILMIAKLIRKFTRQKRKFYISKKVKKIINTGFDPRLETGMEIEIFEDKKGKYFTLLMNEKETKEFEDYATFVSQDQKVPKYMFKCEQCKIILPLPLKDTRVILFGGSGGKATTKYLCILCAEKKALESKERS